MRHAVLSLVLAGAPAFAALAAIAAAPGPEGVWRTEKGPKGGSLAVEVAPCAAGAATLCGVIVRTFDMDRPDLVGVVLLRDMQARDAFWSGEVWSPDKERAYESRMRMQGADLRIEGCMLSICKSQIWTRLE